MLHKDFLRKKFLRSFSTTGETLLFFAPGRLCLIGEHIDYNGGLVLPAAISLGICGNFRKRASGILKMRSSIYENEVTLDLNAQIAFSKERGWGNYPAGVIQELQKRGFEIPGGELRFESNLPVGAGLSSSAAIEVLTAFIFSSLNPGKSLDKVDIAKLCKDAENNFAGVQCGIMDQFAGAKGKRNRALLLDCNSLQHEQIPVELGDYVIVILNTNKKRELTDSLFNMRVNECADAVNTIRLHRSIKHLADANEDDIDWIQNPVVKKRALHVSQENKRVKDAAEALKNNDLEKFGRLISQSHDSLRSQYEVTGRELDVIQQAAIKHPACIGAKMSGAGFGGCAFALVRRDAVKQFINHTQKEYTASTGLIANCYLAEIDDGVRQIK